jgi:hypothetical protein
MTTRALIPPNRVQSQDHRKERRSPILVQCMTLRALITPNRVQSQGHGKEISEIRSPILIQCMTLRALIPPNRVQSQVPLQVNALLGHDEKK